MVYRAIIARPFASVIAVLFFVISLPIDGIFAPVCLYLATRDSGQEVIVAVPELPTLSLLNARRPLGMRTE